MNGGNSSNTIELKFACGHTAERRKRTPGTDTLAIRSAASKLCDVCASVWDAQRKGLIADSILRAEEASKLELTGSRKQIEWAVRIRERWLFNVKRDIPSSALQPNINRARYAPSAPEQAIAIEQAITNVLVARLAGIDEVLARREAAWWIDWRYQLNDRINRVTDDAIRSRFEFLRVC